MSKEILRIVYPIPIKERVFDVTRCEETIADKTGFALVLRQKDEYRPKGVAFTYDLPDGSYLIGVDIHENYKPLMMHDTGK